MAEWELEITTEALQDPYTSVQHPDTWKLLSEILAQIFFKAVQNFAHLI